MNVDLHVHSKYSNPQLEIKNIIKFAKKKNLQGVAITEHNELSKSFKENDFIILSGVEISSLNGHILAIGIKEKIQRGLSIEETIEKIEKQNGIAIVPHPYRLVSGIGGKNAKKFKIIETINARSLQKTNENAKKLALQLNATQTGGSDAHTFEEIGNAFTEFSINSFNDDEILEEVRKGKIIARGEGASVYFVLRNSYENAIKWLRRGMKRV